jgi:RNA polymerase sigma-70 factor (ECF subfamily)
MVETGVDHEPRLSWPQSVAEFDALIEATQHRLVQFAYCRVHSLADAEDVVQDVYIQAFRDRERNRDIENVVPFLFRMVANRATDLLRKRNRQAQLPAGAVPAASDGGSGHERQIERLLDHLPKRQAAAIRLRIYGDLSFESVARSEGCSVPTVKSRFRYGIQKLRRMLECEGGAQ